MAEHSRNDWLTDGGIDDLIKHAQKRLNDLRWSVDSELVFLARMQLAALNELKARRAQDEVDENHDDDQWFEPYEGD
jgi:hypothetical protein